MVAMAETEDSGPSDTAGSESGSDSTKDIEGPKVCLCCGQRAGTVDRDSPAGCEVLVEMKKCSKGNWKVECECVSCFCTRQGVFGKGQTSLTGTRRKSAKHEDPRPPFPDLLESNKRLRKSFYSGRKITWYGSQRKHAQRPQARDSGMRSWTLNY